MKNLVLAVCFTASIITISNCARNPVTGKRQLVTISEEQELAMGREADPQIVQQFGLYQDSAIQRFMRLQGQQMVRYTHRPNIPYQFRVLNSATVNAFAIPGYVYFTRGIMAYFNNEAQFQGVLGHELGHIAARHTVTQQRNQLLSQLGILAGAIISPTFGQFAETAMQGASLILLKNSRDDEREADKLGVEYSVQAGFDATEMAEFFITLKRQGDLHGQVLPGLLATHPDPGERYENVAAWTKLAIKKLNVGNLKIDRESYLRMIEGIIYGENPREGFVENFVFYHPELRFQFPIPQGWRHVNTPQMVQMSPQDSRALLMLTIAQGNSLQQAAQNTLQQYQLQVVATREVTINGLPALMVEAQQQQQQQQNAPPLRILLTFIQYDNAIYQFLGVSSAADYAAYSQYFLYTMQNFNRLADPVKLNRQPERIRLRTVDSPMTLQQALLKFGIPQARLNEFAILNGRQLNDVIQAGVMLKVVQF